MTDFAAARINMVENQVRCNAVTDARLIAAMSSVPRELFVPDDRRGVAYMDEDVSLDDGQGAGRYLMQPRAFAKLAQLAEVQESDHVLDIGAGPGYSSAVLSRLARTVIALEVDEVLAATATTKLAELGASNVTVVTGRLNEGYAKGAPYDVIFLGGATPVAPENLFDQLKDGGRLVVVTGSGPAAHARIFIRAHGAISSRMAFDAKIHALPGFEVAESFVF
ncbi:methyltransferase domain-containing protein [Parvibaculum sedimenti]|uniref:Protein-L-isoaspartate O-methyltransferase n=1 Tax=Parvibaculum sedimenti TaxID=2608632 RepID=A0A6N6VJY7_9HYPH|nr:protein-L-isoaspartate O-methyltransferase [Parvibaculum sedimenti]KAB7739617.1 methyltransferase domain-containing protein [Parvibaculum sedimenti]